MEQFPFMIQIPIQLIWQALGSGPLELLQVRPCGDPDGFARRDVDYEKWMLLIALQLN
jgi:hypothetical protein